ncbi:MAG: zinc-binding dehydrogenase [Salibacteraceae bacterium]
MKAIVLTKDGNAHDAFEFQTLPIPECKPNEALVKVSHFGLNYADIMARRGLYNDRPPLPCVLGYEVVGTIDKVGAEVSDFAVGDLVLGFTQFGGYAEYAVTNERALIKLNAETNPEEATALATQYCTAWFAACHMINLKKGDRVLIHAAAGGVGTALVQIAKWKGCEIIGTAGSDEKTAHLKKQGVNHAINYRKHDFTEEINSLLGDHRLDVIFDPIGGSNFKKSMALLGSGGRIAAFGASEWSSSQGNLMDKLKLVFGFGFLHPIGLLMKSKTVIGVNMLRIGENKPEYLNKTMQEVYEQYQKGILQPIIDSVHDAKYISSAHQRLESRKSIGKVVVKW